MTRPAHRAWPTTCAARRALGFRLRRDEKLLAQFLDYLDEPAGDGSPSMTRCAGRRCPSRAEPGLVGIAADRGARLRRLPARPSTRGTEVPPGDLLPGRSRRAMPYLYSDADIAALMAAAADAAARRCGPRPTQR